MTSTPRAILYVVVITLALLSLIGMASLAGTLFFRNYADSRVLTAFISITSGSIGALSALLVNTRQPIPDTTVVSTSATAEHPATVTVDPTT